LILKSKILKIEFQVICIKKICFFSFTVTIFYITIHHPLEVSEVEYAEKNKSGSVYDNAG
jgi:hypothetical protein